MKKIYLFVFAVFLVSSVVEAKYVKQPEGLKTKEDYNAEYVVKSLDKDADGKLSLDEYKQKVVTRDVRRMNRNDQKMGIYRTPEEEFELMDADGDGFILIGDLSYYLVHKSNERNAKQRLPYPVKKRIKSVEGEKHEVIEYKKNRSGGYYYPEEVSRPIEAE